ncbi:hypothetical protein Q9966_016200, partial [Columba livia]
LSHEMEQRPPSSPQVAWEEVNVPQAIRPRRQPDEVTRFRLLPHTSWLPVYEFRRDNLDFIVKFIESPANSVEEKLRFLGNVLQCGNKAIKIKALAIFRTVMAQLQREEASPIAMPLAGFLLPLFDDELSQLRESSISLFRDLMNMVVRNDKREMKNTVRRGLLPLFFRMSDQVQSVAKDKAISQDGALQGGTWYQLQLQLSRKTRPTLVYPEPQRNDLLIAKRLIDIGSGKCDYQALLAARNQNMQCLLQEVAQLRVQLISMRKAASEAASQVSVEMSDWALQNAVVAEGMAPPQRILFPPEKICMAWQHSQRAGAGLCNLGNTCFLNSVLQCLTYTPPLANHLLSGEHSQACSRTAQELFPEAVYEEIGHSPAWEKQAKFGHSGSSSEQSLTHLQPYPGYREEEDGLASAPGCICSLSPVPLSFQMFLFCLGGAQWMAMMMPGRFLTLGRTMPLDRELGKCPGCQRREQDPGMHPEVRGKLSAPGAWGAIPTATLVAAALRPKPPGKGEPAPGVSCGGTEGWEKELSVVRSRGEGDAQTPWGELQCPALLLEGGSLCSQRSARVPGAEGDTMSLSLGSMGYDDAEEISLAHL